MRQGCSSAAFGVVDGFSPDPASVPVDVEREEDGGGAEYGVEESSGEQRSPQRAVSWL